MGLISKMESLEDRDGSRMQARVRASAQRFLEPGERIDTVLVGQYTNPRLMLWIFWLPLPLVYALVGFLSHGHLGFILVGNLGLGPLVAWLQRRRLFVVTDRRVLIGKARWPMGTLASVTDIVERNDNMATPDHRYLRTEAFGRPVWIMRIFPQEPAQAKSPVAVA